MTSRKDDLFELIRSLNKGEKKAFKRLAQIEGTDSQYVQLFDFLNDCENYDEAQIKNAFPQIQQLHRAKNYLHKAVMRSLRFIRKNTDTTIYAQIRNIELLMARGLYKQSEKIIRRLKKRCKKEERFEDLLRVLRIELQLKKNNKSNQLDLIYEEQKQILKILENEFEYRTLYNQLLALIRKSFSAQNIEDPNELSAIMAHPLLSNSQKALSIRAEKSFTQCHIVHNRMTRNSEKVHYWSQNLVSQFKKHPFLKEEYVSCYLSGLLNLLGASLTLDHLEEFVTVRNILEKYKKRSTRIAIFIFEYTATPTLIYWFEKKKDKGKGKQFLKKLEKELVKYQGQMSKEGLLMFYGNFAIHYFNLKEFTQVQKWIAKLQGVLEKNFREDVASFTRILNLVVHYELKNWDYIQSEADATLKYLQRHHILFEPEKKLLNFLKTTQLELLSKTQLIENFRVLNKKIHPKKDEKTLLKEFVNFFDWIAEKTN